MTAVHRKLSRTEQFIDSARRLLRPDPVESGKTPQWVRKAVIDCRDRRGVSASDCSMGPGWCPPVCIRAATGLDVHDLFDHWGRCGEVMVCEPYSVGADVARLAVDLANALECNVLFSSNSWWYPGRTVRIEFHQRKVGGVA